MSTCFDQKNRPPNQKHLTGQQRHSQKSLGFVLPLPDALRLLLSGSFSLFQLISAYFSLFQLISAYFSLFQLISAYFSLFQPLSGSFNIAHQKPQFGDSVVLKQNSGILADPPVELV
jgi:hypothetical protein